ncbi:MAG: glycerol-3-phosphate 1-O-acyltransferase PlsY, partial [Candidatus Rokuibacteriota bacterium]
FGVADIRRHGSGTIGATNVLRTAGRLPAILTLGGDIAKGYLAVVAGAALAASPAAPDTAVVAASAVAAVIGNCWSVFLGFRGGKGVATGLGALLKIVPLAVLPAALVWLVVTISFRYVSLGSILAASCVPLSALVLGMPAPFVIAAFAVGAIVVARHHANITRLLAGHEPKLGHRRSA